MRSATPATILVLAATVLLVFVTCSTPLIKSISFLDATIGGSGNESGKKAKLGCLGYCIGDTCQGPTLGYSFDPNQLLGIKNPSAYGHSISTDQYTTAVVHGLTYALVLNPIALVACALTVLTGILAHCGDWSLVCINSFVSGLASTITLVATAVNFALFVIAKKRINSINGASAELGVAVWLTLAAWILIVLSSCAFCCGCGGGRKSGRNKTRHEEDGSGWKAPSGGNSSSYNNDLRMDALRAESERKRNRDVPKYAEYETEHIEELPLTNDYDGAHGYRNGVPDQYSHVHNTAYGNASSVDHHSSFVSGQQPARGVQPAGRYYDADAGMAGFAAHNAVSPATEHPQEYYDYNQHPQYYGDGSMHATPMEASGNQEYFYAPEQPGSIEQQQQQYSHSYQGYDGNQQYAQHSQQASAGYESQYSNMGHQGYAMPANQSQQQYYGHQDIGVARSPDMQSDGFGGLHTPQPSSTPYDAVEQATAAGRARRLPETPAAGSQHLDPNAGTLPHYDGSGSNSYNDAYSGVASNFDDQSPHPMTSSGYPVEKR